MDSQKFCLKWDNFQGSVTSLFDSLRQNDELVDITLCCEGQKVRAHRMMLSACSPYFRDVLKDLPFQQTVFFLKDTSAADLRSIVEFMYRGSVNVAQSQLATFIKTAETLQIRGLSGDEDKPQSTVPAPAPAPASPAVQRAPAPEPPPPPPPPAKRRRVSSLPGGGGGGEPQLIDCTLSPDPEPAEVSPTTPSQHAMASPAPPSTSGYPAADNGYSRGDVQPYGVKVEKVEMIGSEQDAGLGSALEHVAEFESDYDDAGYDEAYSNLDAEGAARLDPNESLAAASMSGDDGSQKDHLRCRTCGKTFNRRDYLQCHERMHAGETRCPVCGRVYSAVFNLRSHMMGVHGLSRERVRCMIPTRATQRHSVRYNLVPLANSSGAPGKQPLVVEQPTNQPPYL